MLKRPNLMRSNPRKQDRTKYYWYHRDHDHDTEDCIELKDEIKNLIRRGWLRQFMTHPEGHCRHPTEQPKLPPPHKAPP